MATTPTQIAPEITAVDGHAVTTSIAIAEYFRKLHKNVIQKIESLECSQKFSELNFQPVEYIDAKGERRPAYQITRDGFAFLAMSFTGKRAAVLKGAYINAFNQMEQALMARLLLDDPRLEDALTHAQRLHHNLKIVMELWQEHILPLNPPIMVSGTFLDSLYRSGVVAEGIERVMQGTVPDRLRGKTWVL
ncbi:MULTISPECIES: Rha family transcriptional regulator [Symbiopectobacterium]|uniref:Rha family transcriptional regulator n=1 Tax=Symbiopectobacterium TaxID=801 RepID=UPI0027DFCA58|nr:Rha family transcriptional regulator [Candidatus Symbiopectobacterium endolongispinus]